MSELLKRPFLILDCQTTGMRPSVGHLLELGWSIASAETVEPVIHSFLIQLPEDGWLPGRVSEVTGIYEKDLKDAHPIDMVKKTFEETLGSFQTGEIPMGLVHYAQFEQPFLLHFLKTEPSEGDAAQTLPFDLLCTHKIAKKLYPTVPSRNIRGLTGFFGARIGDIKRAGQHVRATHLIWQGIVAALGERGIEKFEQLQNFLAEAPPKLKRGEKKPKAPSFEYRVDREKRLALPEAPGIYKMKAKDGSILYVGKATSLRDRVNSYFRGKKGRDPRKLELIAQVWDLETVECGSALEAALLESDEIKRLDPPYNVSLKNQNRSLLFYSRDFESFATAQDADHPIGPFRRFNSVDHVRLAVQGLRNGLVANVFYQPIETDVLNRGFEMFRDKHPEFDFDSPSIRSHLSYGFKLLRKLAVDLDESLVAEPGEVPGGEDDKDTLLVTEEQVLTPEDLVEDFEHVYIRAAESLLRSKKLTKLLSSTVSWFENGQPKSLSFRRGQVVTSPASDSSCEHSWAGLGISDFDRMSILLSELARFSNPVD